MSLSEEAGQERANQKAAPRLHYAVIMVGVGLLCLIGSLGFSRFCYALLLPAMQKDFQTSYTQMGSIATANALAYMISALVCGLLTSRFGARGVISLSLFLCVAGLVITGFAAGVEQAAIGQFICGLGTGGAVGPVYSIAGPWFVAHRRGMATGIIQMGSGAGLVLGGLLVPQLLAAGGTMGWRFAWYILAGLVLITAILATLFLSNHPSEKNLAPLGANDQPRPDRKRPAAIAPDSSLTTLGSIYRSPRLWHVGLTFTCFGLSYVVYTIFFAAYLLSRGFSNEEAGLVWGLAGLVSVAGSVFWGWLADRRGRRFTLVMVLLIQAVALAELSLLHARPTLYFGAMLYGLALWGMPVVISLIAGEIAGPKFAPAAVGLVIVLFSVGQVIGPLLAGWLKDTSGSLELPLLVASAIAGFGAILGRFIRV